MNPDQQQAGHLSVRSRLAMGALAGMAATLPMTSAMSRMHRLLPPDERYPLPPREITERLLGNRPDETIKDAAATAHFAYGAVTGALIAAVRPRLGPVAGAVAGVGIWTASYFGWVPGAAILKPAHRHPPRRSALMIAAHLIWGAATALALRELETARGTTLRNGPLKDRADQP